MVEEFMIVISVDEYALVPPNIACSTDHLTHACHTTSEGNVYTWHGEQAPIHFSKSRTPNQPKYEENDDPSLPADDTPRANLDWFKNLTKPEEVLELCDACGYGLTLQIASKGANNITLGGRACVHSTPWRSVREQHVREKAAGSGSQQPPALSVDEEYRRRTHEETEVGELVNSPLMRLCPVFLSRTTLCTDIASQYAPLTSICLDVLANHPLVQLSIEMCSGNAVLGGPYVKTLKLDDTCLLTNHNQRFRDKSWPSKTCARARRKGGNDVEALAQHGNASTGPRTLPRKHKEEDSPEKHGEWGQDRIEHLRVNELT
ncbi:hypothetical protein BC629DRAFT_1438940 [Irpex lacteus]|nr:hypothetical protein BC629DRAFT_1438940 [Irpex lacteus]